MNVALDIPTRAALDRAAWADRTQTIRAASLALAAPLSAEDQQVQSMPDVSPTKWHLAHITWFFETFLLNSHLPDYTPFDPRFGFLFNSYYETVGDRTPRHQRGLITRPTHADILAYRAHVDAAITHLIHTAPAPVWTTLQPLLELGLHHEQQHQELILMDIKHVLSCNPLQPAYFTTPPPSRAPAATADWIAIDGGLHDIGHAGASFAFDNELPRHRFWLDPFRIASRLVTNGEYRAFIADGGYHTPRHWLSDGWATVKSEAWQAPLYWQPDGTTWSVFTLHGRHPIDDAAPVIHLSYYEADAYARWAGHRLPTEAEWEHAATTAAGLHQLHDEAWQFTASPYVAYPGFKPDEGAIGEYNGKFMVNQIVLRGSASITPAHHTRPTYRNFFPPDARWMFGGLRLAE